MINEYHIDLIDNIKHMDLNDPCSEMINSISDKDIRWLIDHYDLTKHNAKIFGMRYNWEHENFSRKQRWMVIAESHHKERAFFNLC